MWPDEAPDPAFVRSLSPYVARQAALLLEAARLLRGSSYTWFEDAPPEQPTHSALASTYAHTTAPLRRLIDRYVGEACIALSEGKEVPEWVRAELPTLPETMAKSSARAGQYEAGIVSIVEAALLEERRGDTFEAIVVEVDERRGATIAIREPSVIARCRGDDLPLGGRVHVRLQEVDVLRRLLRFEQV